MKNSIFPRNPSHSLPMPKGHLSSLTKQTHINIQRIGKQNKAIQYPFQLQWGFETHPWTCTSTPWDLTSFCRQGMITRSALFSLFVCLFWTWKKKKKLCEKERERERLWIEAKDNKTQISIHPLNWFIIAKERKTYCCNSLCIDWCVSIHPIWFCRGMPFLFFIDCYESPFPFFFQSRLF